MENSTAFQSCANDDIRLKPSDIKLLSVVAYFCQINGAGTCSLSIDLLALYSRLSHPAVYASMKRLVSAGYILKTPPTESCRTNAYELNWDVKVPKEYLCNLAAAKAYLTPKGRSQENV